MLKYNCKERGEPSKERLTLNHKAYPLEGRKGEKKMKTVEQIIEYLEVEVDLARKTARTYIEEYAKGEDAFIPRDKCLEMYNIYLNEYIKLVEVLNFIKEG